MKNSFCLHILLITMSMHIVAFCSSNDYTNGNSQENDYNQTQPKEGPSAIQYNTQDAYTQPLLNIEETEMEIDSAINSNEEPSIDSKDSACKCPNSQQSTEDTENTEDTKGGSLNDDSQENELDATEDVPMDLSMQGQAT
ncbi:hypothetical protein NEFER03_1237 [Nematocida sp. LUAm3]|nr:hypothetical protein NEFER03_1237 [Nematocida sp. LUAm3]KAI5175846.1 hypothetical protein NEFER02_1715 [Nematocida sp. LUAm2]KAI5178342.1 hypothetical protein NEFER01_1509 [Nematocida sp. LUAm1]